MSIRRVGKIACLTLVVALTVLAVQFEPVVAASCTGTGPYSISGTVKRSNGTGVVGVTMSLAGPNGCTSATKTSGLRGEYHFLGLRKGTYTLTPSKAGCAFTPASRVISLAGNATANFSASCL